jgi:hypothetical protein
MRRSYGEKMEKNGENNKEKKKRRKKKKKKKLHDATA